MEPTHLGNALGESVLRAAVGGARAEISSSAADLWNLAIGDRLRHWKVRNLVAVAERTANFLREKNISLEDVAPLPDGELYLLFSGASKADTDDLRALWAGLLASALRSESNARQSRAFVIVAEQLSTYEVRAFDVFCRSNAWFSSFKKIKKQKFPALPYSRRAEERAALRDEFIRQEKVLWDSFVAEYNDITGSDKTMENSIRSNLLRLGLVHFRPIDLSGIPNVRVSGAVGLDNSAEVEHSMQLLAQHLQNSIKAMNKPHDTPLLRHDIFPRNEFSYVLTDFGMAFSQACGID